jgi:hypothetical protein
VHHELQTVADAEHRQTEFKQARIGRRRVFVIHRPRRSRQNDPGGCVALQLIELRSARQHDGKYILFADAARDQLRILRAEIEDDDRLGKRRLAEGRCAELGLGFH